MFPYWGLGFRVWDAGSNFGEALLLTIYTHYMYPDPCEDLESRTSNAVPTIGAILGTLKGFYSFRPFRGLGKAGVYLVVDFSRKW